MHKLLATSAAARPTGAPPQRKLFRVPSGVFQGRLAAIYMDSASGISLQHSDHPYDDWSTAQSIVTDANDSPFGASMDGSGNIYIIYTDNTKNLKFIKLSFASGAWSAGSPATVLTVDDSYNPFVMEDGDGKLWCFFVHHNTSGDSNYYVRVKSSADGGQTWGGGTTDTGTQLSSASAEICYVSAVQIASRLYAVYCLARSILNYRTYDLQAQTWNQESAVHSANYIDDDFDIAASPEGKLGIVFCPTSDGKVYFKEFDGSSWSGLQEVETVQARSPQIEYDDNAAHIVYAAPLGNNYYHLRHAVRSGMSLISSDFSPTFGRFDTVLLYNDLASTQFEDKTSQAGDTSPADIFHSESSALLDSANDCLYLGKQSRFFCAAIILSSPGTGGAVVWEYSNGSGWVVFTPHSGSYNFDSGDKLLYLWQDGQSAPSDWQVAVVNNVNAFWIRARVTTGFSVNPVGTQIIAGLRADDLVLVRPLGSGNEAT